MFTGDDTFDDGGWSLPEVRAGVLYHTIPVFVFFEDGGDENRAVGS